jgi:prepilin-type N-terminal cleavage/methylation domain-containing protein
MTPMRARGFTLIELMVALAIVSLLLMLAAPLYSKWIADNQIQAGAETIASGLRTAMAEAVKQNTSIELVLTPATGWVVQPAGGGTAIQQAGFNEGANRVTVSVTPSASDTVTFTPFGQVAAQNADTSAPFTVVDVTSPVTDTRPLRVLVGGGRTGIKICDPAWPATDPKGCPNASAGGT